MASRAPPRANAASAAGVRRNLFNHHLSRRPTGASTSSSSATQQMDSSKEEKAEIVARHSDGKFAVRIPTLPDLDEDQMPDEVMSQEREKLEATMLAQLYRDKTLQHGDGTELMAGLQASLKRKVASLDNDNWIFEADQSSCDA